MNGGGGGENQSYHHGECICFLCLVGYFIITNVIFLYFTFYINTVGYFSSHVVFLSSLAEPLP